MSDQLLNGKTRIAAIAGALIAGLVLVIALHTAYRLRQVYPAVDFAIRRGDTLFAHDERHSSEQAGLLMAVESTRSVVDSLKSEVRDVRWQVEQLHKAVRGDK